MGQQLQMKILILDPYLTTSHKIWLSNLTRHLNYDIREFTMPAYHWKWRMHAAAIHMAQQLISSGFRPDLILTTEMMDLNLFAAQCRRYIRADLPLVLYFHENQINYPVSHRDRDQKRAFDNHYGFINFTSALVADHIIFNSHYHYNSFFEVLPPFLDKFPNSTLKDSIPSLEEKSSVVYPGFNLLEFEKSRAPSVNDRPIILWNHRWEYDKDPDTFFDVLSKMQADGLYFDIVVLGQAFRNQPQIFSTVRDRFGDRVLHLGFVEDRIDYVKWLWRSDIVISTSHQDYFGISVVEAIYAECYPLLPDRLAFPEHIPSHLRPTYLYQNARELAQKLKSLLQDWPTTGYDRESLVRHMRRYGPEEQLKSYHNIFSLLSQRRDGSPDQDL